MPCSDCSALHGVNPKEGKLVMKIAENTVLEVVNDFNYLIAHIGNSHMDFKQCRGLAWRQFWKLSMVWKSKEISLPLKLRLFDSLILTIIFYNAETKVMKKDRFLWHKLLQLHTRYKRN